ncbi:MAG: T9SS type A sorting domain-containing protein [candidate division Zixibacteria bacterium]|nr:T9SS type A sorting domain-containing protein [candidate division Zixibacteria bacterium]
MKIKIIMGAIFFILGLQFCVANPIPTPFIWEFSIDPPWIAVGCGQDGELDGDTIRTTTGFAIILSSDPGEGHLVVLDSSNTTGFVLNPDGDSIIFSTDYYWITEIGYGTYGNLSGSPPQGKSMVGKIYPVGFPDPYYDVTYEFCTNPVADELGWEWETEPLWGTCGLIINEVNLYNNWRSNSEFIELYNAGSQPVNCDELLLIGNAIYDFPPNLAIEPGEYYIIDTEETPPGFELNHDNDALYLVKSSFSYDQDTTYGVVDQVGWTTDHGINSSFMRWPDGDVNWSNWNDFRGYDDESSYTFEIGFPTRGAPNRHECPGFVVIGARADSIDDATALIQWTDPIWDETFTASLLVKSHEGYVSSPEEGEIIYTGNDQEHLEYDILPDVPYYFTAFARDHGGLYSTPTEESQAFIQFVGVGIEDEPLPEYISVLRCYPNPFNATTTISFSLKHQSPVNISIYDITGRLVDLLASDIYEAGNHSLTWYASDQPSGIYFSRLTAGESVSTSRMVLLK